MSMPRDEIDRVFESLVPGDKIELKQKVLFATAKDKIMPPSFAMLNEIAAVLKELSLIHI